MRKVVLAAVLVLMAGGAQASSYLDIFGVVHDPILTVNVAVHSYSGPNLQPGADLSSADLFSAFLLSADLSNADLSSADLSYTQLLGADLGNSDLRFANLNFANLDSAFLHGAFLNGANLSLASLIGATLSGADLSGSNLRGAVYLGSTFGIPYYDALTDFTGAWANGGTIPFDPVAAGWNLIPEPNTALLVGIGLAGLAARRRV